MIAKDTPRSDAPEPDFTALCVVMRRAVLHARMLIRCQSDEPEARERQIHDLMDAIENIPEYLLRHSGFWAFEGLDKRLTMLSYLKTYDDKWSEAEHGISLLRCYGEAAKIARPCKSPNSEHACGAESSSAPAPPE